MFVLVGTTVNSVSAPRASRTKQTRITRTTVMQSRRIRQTHSTKTLGHARYWHSGTLVDGFVNDVKSSLAEVGAVKQLVRRQPTRGSAGGAKPQRIGLDKVVSTTLLLIPRARSTLFLVAQHKLQRLCDLKSANHPLRPFFRCR